MSPTPSSLADRVLRVYVSADCFACGQTPDAIAAIRARFPLLFIDIIDIEDASEIPAAVFSVPTYTLNGITVSLGNPSADAIERLAVLLQDRNPQGNP